MAVSALVLIARRILISEYLSIPCIVDIFGE